jgi:phosphoribosyl 1,2-cyclic phosphodiesterase
VQSTKRKLRANKLDAIIISHRHLDHAADVNIMVEAMTNGGFNKHGTFFAPADALGEEPVIFTYLRSALDGITILEEGGEYRVGNVSFSTPVRHDHPVETYGLLFRASGHTFAYIADTRYFDEIIDIYNKAELLIINMVLTQPRPPIAHLSIPDVEKIVAGIRPREAILTHFGMHVWQAKPWQIAAELTEKTGVKVTAARDGMKYDLAKLDNDGAGDNTTDGKE